MAGRAFSAFYARNFERRPWITLAVTNGSLGVVADSLAQAFEKYNKSNEKSLASSASSEAASWWDLSRSARFLAFGAGMSPLLAEWNKFIEFRFPLRSAGAASATSAAATSTVSAGAKTGAQGAASIMAGKGALANAGKVSLVALGKRVAVDQGFFAPFGLAMFVGAMGLMEGLDFQGVKRKFSDMYVPALLANWQIWPLIQLVNFRFMPLKYRVPFTSSMGVLWTLYLSLLNQVRGGSTADPDKSEAVLAGA